MQKAVQITRDLKLCVSIFFWLHFGYLFDAFQDSRQLKYPTKFECTSNGEAQLRRLNRLRIITCLKNFLYLLLFYFELFAMHNEYVC